MVTILISTGKPQSSSFNVSLMVTLLRYLTELQPPKLGWDQFPDESDTSVVADLVRITVYENKVNLLADTNIDNTQFIEMWNCFTTVSVV